MHKVMTKIAPERVAQAGGKVLIAVKGRGRRRKTKFLYRGGRGNLVESTNGQPAKPVKVAHQQSTSTTAGGKSLRKRGRIPHARGVFPLPR